LEVHLAPLGSAHRHPTGRLIKALSPRTGRCRQVQPVETLRPQPGDHRIVELAAVATPFVIRIDEQGPDVPGPAVAHRKRYYATLDFDDPSAPRVLDGGNVVRRRYGR